MSQTTQALTDLLSLWFRDMVSFAKCFDIRDKELNTIKFEPTVPQKKLFDALDNNLLVQVLKGRQMFVTTGVGLYVLRECLKHPGFRVAVAAHDDRAAVEIGQFYRALHAGNKILSHLMPTVTRGDHKIGFSNGSQILVGTANSEFWAGFPTHFAHMTEAAKYDNLGSVMASLGQTVPRSGRMVMESTAFGDNLYASTWRDERSQFHKLFLSWLDHPEYAIDTARKSDTTDVEQEYIKRHGLDEKQAEWFVWKFRTMPMEERHLFDREYPAAAEVAFQQSGDKFIRNPIPLPPAIKVHQGGISIIHEYSPFNQYVAGVDTASGSAEGDFSTVVILDVTKRSVAATMQVRLPIEDFKQEARKLLTAYGDPVSTVEINSYGLTVSGFMRDAGVPLYRTEKVRGLATTLRHQHGWETTSATRPILFGSIYEAVCGQSRWKVGCVRLVKEINALVYNDRGKPQAPSSGHDDLAIAFGLALQAVPQAHPASQNAKENGPILTPAQLEWQAIKEGRAPFLGKNEHGYTSLPGDYFD